MIFSLSSTATKDNETFQRSLLAAKIANDKKMGKKAGRDAPPVNIGWDSHKPVVSLGERESNFFCWAENFISKLLEGAAAEEDGFHRGGLPPDVLMNCCFR
jgi:hypothetical protein